MNLNKIVIAGNITRDPETRQAGATSVTSIGIAVNRVWYNQQKEKQEETTFVDVLAWAKLGENIAKYFAKGDPIYIEGRLRQESYEDKEGKKVTKTKVVAESFEFCGKSGRDARASEPTPGDAQPPKAPSRAPRAPRDPDLDVNKDDVPF